MLIKGFDLDFFCKLYRVKGGKIKLKLNGTESIEAFRSIMVRIMTNDYFMLH